jgi:class 3 adenylate cyclase
MASTKELQHLINTASDDTVRCRAALNLAFELRNNNPAEANRLLNEFQALCYANDDKRINAEHHFTKGIVASCSFVYDVALAELFHALESFREMNEIQGEIRSLRWIAITYRNVGMLNTALEYAQQSLVMAEERDLIALIGYALAIVGDCYVLLSDHENGVKAHVRVLELARKTEDAVLQSQALWSLARVFEQLERYEEALHYYQESLDLRKRLHDDLGIGTAQYGIASVQEKQGNVATALRSYLRLWRLFQNSNGPPQTEVFITLGIARLYVRSPKPERARPYLERALFIAEKNTIGSLLSSAYQEMAGFLKKTGKFEQALEYFEKYHQLSQDLSKRESQQTSQYFRQAYEFDKARQENEIYRLRNEELAEVNQQNERLLRNVLPEAIAQRMKAGETTIAEYFENVTVLFADIVGFTELAARHSPRDLVTLLNRIFSAFDIFSEQYNVEKIKTIGDAYMIVGGLPEPNDHHAEAVAKMALEMLDTVRLLSRSLSLPLEIRIGIHTGAVVAGVIGQKKFSYDLWGDTVNTASRMESHGEAGRIHVSEPVYTLLRKDFHFEQREEIEVKGKGKMQTYFLVGKR